MNRRSGLVSVVLWFLFLGQIAWGASEPIQYALDLREPASHLVKVVMTVTASPGEMRLQLPAWNNLYQIHDFARNIQGFTAECDGREERLVRVDLHTWRSGTQPCGKLILRYVAYVAGSSPFSSVVNGDHAFLNFATLLFYLPQDRARGVRVNMLLPEGWKMASLIEGEGNSLNAPNYDALVDSPAEAGRFDEYSYVQGGATYRVIVHADRGDYLPERLLDSLQKITAAETALMRDIPFSRYTFIFHFLKKGEEGGGGMEHRNGTAITIDAATLRNHWETLESVVAHEFFHLWNVKRIRPQALEPIDYIHPSDTRDLWFCEGVTSTYGELSLLRAGLISRETFLQRLAGAVALLQSRPARLFQSVEESGMEAWFEKYDDYLTPERSISYYNKGELVGFLLDLAIRHATRNSASLDDVMRRLNEDFARRGRFFTRRDLQQVIASLAPGFSELGAFFDDCVRGTRELDYGTYLGYAGLKLENLSPAHLGTEPAAKTSGQIRIEEIPNPSAQQLRVREGWLKGETAQDAAQDQ